MDARAEICKTALAYVAASVLSLGGNGFQATFRSAAHSSAKRLARALRGVSRTSGSTSNPGADARTSR